MIQNKRQLEVTKKKLADLQQAYEQVKENPRSDLPPILHQAGLNGIQFLMNDLQADLAEYEKLRQGDAASLSLPSVLDDLPATLVRARIARGWTHRDLAKSLGTTEQQVQKDESGGYARASLQRLSRVADALDITISGKAKLHSRRNASSARRKKPE